MADIFNRRKRSEIMAGIKGTGTSIEFSVSKILHSLGIKAKCHQKQLPGSPDFVLSRHKIVIFTNGCFWHGHRHCRRATLPTTNRVFWEKKVLGNIRRDERQRRLLRKMGWKVITFWSCKKLSVRIVVARLKRAGVNAVDAGETTQRRMKEKGYIMRSNN